MKNFHPAAWEEAVKWMMTSMTSEKVLEWLKLASYWLNKYEEDKP